METLGHALKFLSHPARQAAGSRHGHDNYKNNDNKSYHLLGTYKLYCAEFFLCFNNETGCIFEVDG